jgi:hypothetical protein
MTASAGGKRAGRPRSEAVAAILAESPEKWQLTINQLLRADLLMSNRICAAMIGLIQRSFWPIACKKDVDARDQRGQDAGEEIRTDSGESSANRLRK